MTEIEHIVVSKLDAAQRQLSAAIRMLFSEDDPIATHTLAGAASSLFGDLVEIIAPEKSWDNKAREATSLTQSGYFQIMRRYQNFLSTHVRTTRLCLNSIQKKQNHSRSGR